MSNKPAAGVLLVNLGSPDATDYWSMRRYYKQFLSDRRVIEVNPVLWWFVLNGPILTFRPAKKASDYRAIWNQERDEAPLKTITRASAEKVTDRLAGKGLHLEIDWAMRYGNPSIRERIEALKIKGCDRILLFPLYPQYSASTTGSVCDDAFNALRSMRWQPTLRIVPPYYTDPLYIGALRATLERTLGGLDFTPDVVLASFHGIPKAYADKGDPYPEHCEDTEQMLREWLGWNGEKLRLTYQSRFGPDEWLQPYTDKTVAALAKAGIKNLAVLTPGFAADCLETIEEIGVENRDIFLENGGTNFAAIPCLNDEPEAIDMMSGLIERELQGWI